MKRTPEEAEIERLRSIADMHRIDSAAKDVQIKRLREQLHESQICDYPLPGAPGRAWIWDKTNDFLHLVPGHVEYRHVWDCEGLPIIGQFVELDAKVGACGAKVHANPYHGAPAYYARECCSDCLAELSQES